MTRPVSITLDIAELPGAIEQSVRAVLATHGLDAALSDAVLRELSRNTSQVVLSLDRSDES